MCEPLIVGLGNPDRGDDGVGPLVAQRLTGLAGARVLTRSGDALALMDDWRDACTVIVIDAAAGSCPGKIHRFVLSPEGAGDPDPALEPTPSSTHGLGIPEAIALGRVLGTLPRRLIVYAVEGGGFAHGAPMTDVVLAAADAVAASVTAEVHGLCGLCGDADR